jgi:hypothetical protein
LRHRDYLLLSSPLGDERKIARFETSRKRILPGATMLDTSGRNRKWAKEYRRAASLLGSPNLEDSQLPAGEEIVEDSHVLDERPKLFLSRGAILKFTETSTKSGESGAQKEDSQCRNDPNERRYQDQKTFRPVSVLEVHGRHPPPEWIPLQEVQEARVEEKRHREAAGFLNPGWFRRYRPLQDEPHRNRSSEQRRPRRHTALLSTTLTRSGGSAK